MFQHLFHGSPSWLLAAVTVGLVLHVGSGGIAILSGTGALIARKGGRSHRGFGTVFFVAMLSMAVAASTLALIAVQRGHLEQMGNAFAGVFAFYLVTTGWLTVRRPQGLVGRAEIGGCAAAVAIAAVALFWLLPYSLGPEGRSHGVPTAAPVILAGVAILLAALDLKVILRGGVSGVSRNLRHLWRMCLGMFIATGSFFIGQQSDMPAVIQGSPVLLLLGFAPLLAMAFWLVQARRVAARRAVPVLA
jgi:uncharacterized membrane protein